MISLETMILTTYQCSYLYNDIFQTVKKFINISNNKLATKTFRFLRIIEGFCLVAILRMELLKTPNKQQVDLNRNVYVVLY